ncbi:hypothetical protein [Streptomyces sp. NPDC002685]|uniref:hypothetical protein n=1 Tax=Streptomyces sp. NPDC002685 TaxID=3154540 RepID=UPI00333076B8
MESLERTNSGTIWGNVWHELEGQYFPHRGWNDMIVPYVTALADGVCEVAYGRSADVDFFDGPYSIELLPKAPRIQVVLKGAPGSISGEMEYGDLVSDVARAGKRLLDVCQQRGWSLDDDVRQLKLILGRLPQGLP